MVMSAAMSVVRLVVTMAAMMVDLWAVPWGSCPALLVRFVRVSNFTAKPKIVLKT